MNWIFSRLSPSYRSTTASGASSTTSENGTDNSDSVSHSSYSVHSDDLEARERLQAAWRKFWEKPLKGEDYWDYN